MPDLNKTITSFLCIFGVYKQLLEETTRKSFKGSAKVLKFKTSQVQSENLGHLQW